MFAIIKSSSNKVKWLFWEKSESVIAIKMIVQYMYTELSIHVSQYYVFALSTVIKFQLP